jgi:exodeoxyribonuclease V alpha subunit
MSKEIKAIIVPERKKYYSHETNFGVYVVSVESCDNYDKLESDAFGDIVIKGIMPELSLTNSYIAVLIPKNDPKYGMGYEVKTIYEKPVTTRDEQRKFLLTLLTERQVESIFDAYPDENIIELIKEGRFDYKIVKNVGEKTYQRIKEKILENEKYQNAIIKLTSNFGISYKVVKKMSEYYGSPDLLLQKVEENPYILTEVDGYGFKTVDEIALKMGVDKESKNRINACVEYILKENGNDGHCYMERAKLVNEAIKLLNISIDRIEEVLNNGNLKYTTTIEGIVYLNKYYFYEKGISEHLQRILTYPLQYKIEKIDDIIKQVEEKQGFKFTEEQLKAIHLSATNNIVVVNGKAGTGKTSVIKGIIEMHQTIKGLSYATCALSGKASQRIQEATGLESYTIHRLLGWNGEGFNYNEFNQLPHDIIILDEASMVNSQLFYYLLRAIKDGAKIIIAGDTAQLEPIGIGNALADIIASKKIPSVELTIVHRQAQKSGILSCANMVRDGKKFISNNITKPVKLGELEDLYLYPYDDKEKVFKAILSISKKYSGDILDYQVVVPMKSRGILSTKNINNELQKIFNQSPDLVDSRAKIERKDYTFLEGDKVIINGNNYEKNCFNGTIGIIRYIDSQYKKNGNVVGEIVIDFEGVGLVTFTKEEMNSIDLAYAITAHKSQGSQWRYVVFALDYSSYVLLNRQLVYTAMTRAKEFLFMPVEVKALQYAIDTDKSSKRLTFLESMIVDLFENNKNDVKNK